MIKQVIVARTDLDMPIGRIPAQVAHASIAIFLDMGEWDGNNLTIAKSSFDKLTTAKIRSMIKDAGGVKK